VGVEAGPDDYRCADFEGGGESAVPQGVVWEGRVGIPISFDRAGSHPAPARAQPLRTETLEANVCSRRLMTRLLFTFGRVS
jgi:hypothetical protein